MQSAVSRDVAGMESIPETESPGACHIYSQLGWLGFLSRLVASSVQLGLGVNNAGGLCKISQIRCIVGKKKKKEEEERENKKEVIFLNESVPFTA